MTTLRRCQNIADSCWREFRDDEFHLRLGDRVFCSESCAHEWALQNKTFEDAVSPHKAGIHTSRAHARLDRG